ncbi:MAG: hypothetical protein HOV83_02825 [Catenulispora sp.]|nr:hypothetical protein [Catenulispora sp.]
MIRLKALLASGVLATALLGLTGTAVRAADPANPELAQAIADWYAQGGSKHLNALGKDFSAVAKAATATDIPGVSKACTSLGDDVEKAQKYRAMPDAEAQKHWSAALALYAKGADDCVDGADHVDAAKMNKSNTEITQGSKELNLTTERVKEILK